MFYALIVYVLCFMYHKLCMQCVDDVCTFKCVCKLEGI